MRGLGILRRGHRNDRVILPTDGGNAWYSPPLQNVVTKPHSDSVHRVQSQAIGAAGWNVAPGRCCPNCGAWVSGGGE